MAHHKFSPPLTNSLRSVSKARSTEKLLRVCKRPRQVVLGPEIQAFSLLKRSKTSLTAAADW